MKIYIKNKNDSKYVYKDKETEKVFIEKPGPHTLKSNWYNVTSSGIPASEITEIRFERFYSGNYDKVWSADNSYNVPNAIKCYRNGTICIISNEDPYHDYILAPTSSYRLFYNLGELRNIAGFSMLKFNLCTNASYMFYDCRKLRTIDDIDTHFEKVTSIYGMFYNCWSIAIGDDSLMPNFNSNFKNLVFNSLVDMGYAFYNCESIIDLDINGWNTSSVTNMAHCFQSCEKLRWIGCSDFDVRNVRNMQGTFVNGRSSGPPFTRNNSKSFDTDYWGRRIYYYRSLTDVKMLKLQSTEGLVWEDGKYYIYTSDKYYTPYSGGFSSSSTYYIIDDSGTSTTSSVYQYVPTEPSDWSANYNNYYIIQQWYNERPLKNVDLHKWRPVMCQNLDEMFWGCSNLLSTNVPYWMTNFNYKVGDEVMMDINSTVNDKFPVKYRCIQEHKSTNSFNSSKFELVDISCMAVNNCNGFNDWSTGSYRATMSNTNIFTPVSLNMHKWSDIIASYNNKFLDTTLKYYTRTGDSPNYIYTRVKNPTLSDYGSYYIVDRSQLLYKIINNEYVREYYPDADLNIQYYLPSEYEPKFCSCDHFTAHCNNLRRQTFDTWDFENFTNIDCMLNSALSYRDIISTGETINGVYYEAGKMVAAAYDVASWDVSNVIVFAQLFETYNSTAGTGKPVHFRGLENWNTSHALDMRETFHNIYSADYLDLSSFDTCGVIYYLTYVADHPRCSGYEVKNTRTTQGLFLRMMTDLYSLIDIKLGKNVNTRGYGNVYGNTLNISSSMQLPIPSKNSSYNIHRDEDLTGQWFWVNHPLTMTDEEATFTSSHNDYFYPIDYPNPYEVCKQYNLEYVELVAVGSVADTKNNS